MDIKGFRFSAVEAAIKKPGRLDLALILSEVPAAVAAVFTTNKVKAAPVLLDEERVKTGTLPGAAREQRQRQRLHRRAGDGGCAGDGRTRAGRLGIPDEELLVASTGVIGEPLPMERLRKGIPPLVDSLAAAA